MDALAFMPATELAARIRDGSFTAREVVEATIRRIEAIEPQIGAFVELDAEAALEHAATIAPGDRRPFAGVPIAVKANTAVAGMCMNYASRFLAGHRPTRSRRGSYRSRTATTAAARCGSPPRAAGSSGSSPAAAAYRAAPTSATR